MSKGSFEKQHGHYVEDMAIGMTAIYEKTLTEADVALFAGVSGNTNPFHLNEAFASQTRFGRRIVHGMLTTSLWFTFH